MKPGHVFLLAGFLSIPLIADARQDPSLPSLEEIRAYHLARIASLQTIQFDFEGGGFANAGPSPTREGTIEPGIDYPVAWSGTYVQKGESRRLDRSFLSGPDSPTGSESSGRYTLLFHQGEGLDLKFHFERATRSADDPTAEKSADRMMIAYSTEYLDGGRRREPMAVLREEVNEEGRRVVVVGNTEYNQPNRIGLTRIEYFLDVERGYLPYLRVAMTADGTPGRVIRVDYTEVEGFGFVPAKYSDTWMDPRTGRATSAMVYELQGVRVNEPVDDSIFEVEIPEGWTVSDRITGERSVIGADAPPQLTPEPPTPEPTPTASAPETASPAVPRDPMPRPQTSSLPAHPVPPPGGPGWGLIFARIGWVACLLTLALLAYIYISARRTR